MWVSGREREWEEFQKNLESRSKTGNKGQTSIPSRRKLLRKHLFSTIETFFSVFPLTIYSDSKVYIIPTDRIECSENFDFSFNRPTDPVL